MCYHSGLDKKTLNIITAEWPASPWPGAESFPEDGLFREMEQVSAMTRPVFPALTMAAPEELRPLQWMLIPPWFRSPEELKAQKIWSANIRIEEAETKNLFKPHLEGHRGLVFFSHFFEWRHEGKKKIKYRIALDDGDPLVLPCLYNPRLLEGQAQPSFAVFTMEARGIMRYIHNAKLRQPVALSHEAAEIWMNPDCSFLRAREAVLDGELSASFSAQPPPGPAGADSSGNSGGGRAAESEDRTAEGAGRGEQLGLFQGG